MTTPYKKFIINLILPCEPRILFLWLFSKYLFSFGSFFSDFFLFGLLFGNHHYCSCHCVGFFLLFCLLNINFSFFLSFFVVRKSFGCFAVFFHTWHKLQFCVKSLLKRVFFVFKYVCLYTYMEGFLLVFTFICVLVI